MPRRSWDAPPDPDKLAGELAAMQRGAQYDAHTGGERPRFGYVLACGCRVAVSGRALPATQLEMFCRNHRRAQPILEAKGKLPPRRPPEGWAPPATPWRARL